MEETEIKLPKTVYSMFVAREQNGCLYLHTFKPEYNRLTGEWSNHGYKTMIRVELFPKLKYYHQPVEVEIVEKNKKSMEE